jgi:hypothetical protein
VQKIVKKTGEITPFFFTIRWPDSAWKMHSPTLSTLADDAHLLNSSKGVTFRYPLVLIAHMAADGFEEKIKP